MIVLTKQRIESLQTPSGSFTFACLREMGVAVDRTRVPKWKGGMIGKRVSEEQWRRIRQAARGG